MPNKLSVLIVEDNEDDANALTAEINAHADKLCFAGTSKSSIAALDYIRNHKPHAVILDLELQGGYGDGLDLLEKLQSTVVCPKPYIIVNTNSPSVITRNAAKRYGADYEFAKWQKGYSPKMVIAQLLRVAPVILGYEEEPPAPLNDQQLEIRMCEFLQDEFNKLGVCVKDVGYNYLVDAVILATKGENSNLGKIIGEKAGISSSGVMHSMQYTIDKTWKNNDINHLQKHYTAPIRKDRYEPTSSEFVFFYKQKLINHLNNY